MKKIMFLFIFLFYNIKTESEKNMVIGQLPKLENDKLIVLFDFKSAEEIEKEECDRYRNHELFLHVIGKAESKNDYRIVNKYGYLGRFQFSQKTLKRLGYKVSDSEFLNCPELQDDAMEKLLIHNKKILQKYICKYKGQMIKNIIVTESGILAGCHLAGPKWVRRWLRTNGKSDKRDGMGTRVSEYIGLLSGYNLNI